MELGHNIKGRRAGLGLSQDDLAAQVYVSRQTISSWENDKTYPDVQSLLLLSETFGVAVDALIKGDREAMEKTVSRDARHVTHLTAAMIVLLIAAFVALVWAGWQELDGWGTHTIPTFVLAGVLWIGAMVAAVLIERIKKQYDVETYREILAFVEGREIDRSARLHDWGKFLMFSSPWARFNWENVNERLCSAAIFSQLHQEYAPIVGGRYVYSTWTSSGPKATNASSPTS